MHIQSSQRNKNERKKPGLGKSLLNHQSSTIHHSEMSVEYACVFSVLHTHESRIAQGQILMLASMWESFPTFNFSSSFFFSYVLMEVPLFEMLIQFNKVKTHNMQQPILDKSFALVAQLLLFLPSRPKKQNMKASKSITKLSKNLGLLKSGELHSMYTRFFGYESFFSKF